MPYELTEALATAAAEIARKDLIAAAKDVNSALGITPPIKTTAVKTANLIDELSRKAYGEGADAEGNLLADVQQGVAPGDKLKKATWETLAAIGNEVAITVVKPKAKATPKAKAKAASKAKATTKPAPKKKATPKAKAVPKDKYHRGTSLVDAMRACRGRMTKDEWAAKADEKYTAKMGGDAGNLSVSKRLIDYCLPALIATGAVVKNDDKTFSKGENI